MTSPSETDAAVQTDADDLDVVKVPWHLLGAIHCFTRGFEAAGFHKSLLVPSAPTRLLKALKATQSDPEATTDGLLDRAVQAAAAFGKPGSTHVWDKSAWPSLFPIILKRNTLDLHLSKNGLIVPWPLPVTVSGDVEAARDAALVGTAPDPILASVLPNHGLFLNAFMHATDAAVTTAAKAFRDALQKGDTPRGWITAQAVSTYSYSGPPYPSTVTVTLDPMRESKETEWWINRSSGSMDLRLGAKELYDDTKIRNMMELWPCGAFTGM